MAVQLSEKVVRFLRRGARPSIIQADEKKIEIAPNGRVRWKDVDQTLAAIGPKKIECLDARGNVLRAMEIEGDVTSEGDADEKSPEMSDLQYFAKLLTEGYDKGGNAAGKLLDQAMRFVEAQGVRLQQSDREVDRLRLENTKLRREIAELAALPVGETGEGGIVQELITGYLTAQQEAVKAGVTPIKQGAKK